MIAEEKIEEVIKKAIDIYVPSKKEVESMLTIAKSVKERLEKYFSCSIGGSVSRGTFLKGEKEIDIHVLFKTEDKMKDLEKVIKKEFKKYEKIRGSRDYYAIYHKDVKIEIVPVLEIEDPRDAKNVVDLSQFHVQYLKKRIDEDLRKNIVITKKFTKACSSYGAESFIQGFSGYSLEVIMLYFKKFKRLVIESDYIRPQYVIDIENYYTSFEELRRTLGLDKIKSPLIVIDPVYKERNICASLSYNSFAKWIFNLRLFKRNPDLKFFEDKITIKKLKNRAKKRGTKYIIKKFKIEGNKDIFLTKLKKKVLQLEHNLKNFEISLYDYNVFEENGFGIVFVEYFDKEKKIIRHLGPPPWIPNQFFDKFLIKLQEKEVVYGPYIWKNRICVDVKKPNINRKIKEEFDKLFPT